MSTRRRPRIYQVLTRWLFGTALVSWRYMWETTPLHRAEQQGDAAEDGPPELPEAIVDDSLQQASDGVGSLFHRRFQVQIVDAARTADELVAEVVGDFARFVPSEVVEVRPVRVSEGGLQVGDEVVVEMPGPWDGPVRVVHVDDTTLRLATLRGHLEAGQVQFHARHDGDRVVFEVEAWARPSTRLVHLLYARLRLAKEIQLNMWVRFCLAAAATAGGRAADGVHISTRWVAPSGSEAPVAA